MQTFAFTSRPQKNSLTVAEPGSYSKVWNTRYAARPTFWAWGFDLPAYRWSELR